MVFNVFDEIVGNCEVYRLTFDGYRQISKCFKNTKTLHFACENHAFYETAPYIFEYLPLKMSDFITDDSAKDMDFEIIIIIFISIRTIYTKIVYIFITFKL